MALILAAGDGHLSLLRWAAEERGQAVPALTAAAGGHIDVLRYCAERYGTTRRAGPPRAQAYEPPFAWMEHACSDYARLMSPAASVKCVRVAAVKGPHSL